MRGADHELQRGRDSGFSTPIYAWPFATASAVGLPRSVRRTVIPAGDLVELALARVDDEARAAIAGDVAVATRPDHRRRPIAHPPNERPDGHELALAAQGRVPRPLIAIALEVPSIVVDHRDAPEITIGDRRRARPGVDDVELRGRANHEPLAVVTPGAIDARRRASCRRAARRPCDPGRHRLDDRGADQRAVGSVVACSTMNSRRRRRS